MIWTTSLRTFLACAVAIVSAFLQQPSTPKAWVSPAYPAGPSAAKEIVSIDRYSFVEFRYEPAVVVTTQDRPLSGCDDSPEHAFMCRLSAMMSGDYDAWLAGWDDKSRSTTLQRDKDARRSPQNWINEWKGVFTGARAVMIRRIVSGPYVVIMFSLRPLNATSTGASNELPTVFRKTGQRWLATLELARDPLVPAAPWVSGQLELEMVVR